MARRRPAQDFDHFKGLFETCHAQLRDGTRKLLPFRNPQQTTEGSFFVLNGVLVYVAHIGERRQDATGDSNARMRCIFENALSPTYSCAPWRVSSTKMGSGSLSPRQLLENAWSSSRIHPWGSFMYCGP